MQSNSELTHHVNSDLSMPLTTEHQVVNVKEAAQSNDWWELSLESSHSLRIVAGVFVMSALTWPSRPYSLTIFLNVSCQDALKRRGQRKHIN